MKKLYTCVTLLLLMIVAVGCKKKEKEPVQEAASANLVKTVFTIGEKSQASSLKTTLNDNLSVIWEDVDRIFVCSQNWRENARNYSFELTEGACTTMGIFEGEAPADISHPVYCIYPCINEPQKQGKPSFATRASDIEEPLVIYNKLYDTRNYEMGYGNTGRPTSCLHGVGMANETNHFTFKHLTGLLKLSLKSTEEDVITSISIKSKTEQQLHGFYYVDPTAYEPSLVFDPVEEADSIITMNMPDGGIRVSPSEYSDFIFIVPGGAFADGLVAIIESASGEVRRITVDAAPVQKGGMTTVKRTVNLVPYIPATITVSSDDTQMGTVSPSSVTVTVTEPQTITATPLFDESAFDHWELGGSAVLASGSLKDATISVRCDGLTNSGTAVAYFTRKSETVTDWEGNEYPIVLIGDYWCMNENVRVKTWNPNISLPDLPEKIHYQGGPETYNPAYFIRNSTYYLYNFSAAFGCADIVAAQKYDPYATPPVTVVEEERRGLLCPDGYRIPTQEEWESIMEHDDYDKFNLSNTINGYFDRQSSWSMIGNEPLFASATAEKKSRFMIFFAKSKTFDTTDTNYKLKINAYQVRCIKDR